MRSTGLIPHIPGVMELAAAAMKRKADCIQFIHRMEEPELNEVSKAV
jgi:hypothetical protein